MLSWSSYVSLIPHYILSHICGLKVPDYSPLPKYNFHCLAFIYSVPSTWNSSSPFSQTSVAVRFTWDFFKNTDPEAYHQDFLFKRSGDAPWNLHFKQAPPSHPQQNDSVQVIRVHTLRNTCIVEREKIWVCFPNLLFINYVTLENYLTLLRILFLSCRIGMAKNHVLEAQTLWPTTL